MFGSLWHYGKVARAALKDEKERGAKPSLRRDEREFQAAAIEILETPPSPTGRLLGASLIGFFLLALAWSIIGRLDIHAVLEGKVTPIGQVKVIEPLITGTVKTIAVRQGETVREGDLLVELDPTEQTADRTRLEEDVLISEASSLRLRAAIHAIAKGAPIEGAVLELSPKTPPAAAELQKSLFRQTLAAFDAERHQHG
ncbi:MAG: biotin/lipoyl-binding protein [Hyphomicrobiales bacterium]|nr:biotin/lipoyl-binding protein [Hyphomicrobiales bacterium]